MAGVSFFFPPPFPFPYLFPVSFPFLFPFSLCSLSIPSLLFFVLLFLFFICLSHIQLSVPSHSKQSLMTRVKRKQGATCLFPWGQICSSSNLRGNHPFITRDTLLGLWSKIPTSGISLMDRGPSRSYTPWTPLSPKKLSLGISHTLPRDEKGPQDPVYELGLFQPFSLDRISTS